MAKISGNCLAYIFPAKLNLLEIVKASRPWGLLAQNSLWLYLETIWASKCIGTAGWGEPGTS